MSDQSSKSQSTRPSTLWKQENVTLQSGPMGPAASVSGSPEESQVPEPPPGGGQQPGEDLNKAPPQTSNM